jgi:hypothetical protein
MDNSFDLTIDNLIKSINMYETLIIINDDINVNLIYINSLMKMKNEFNKILKYLEENQDKHPEKYLKYLSYQRKSVMGVI